MKRVSAYIGVLPVECINIRRNKYRVRWDIRPDDRDYGEGVDENCITFVEQEFDHRPTLDEIQSVILAWHNEQIDQKIVSGFKWRGFDVWLSTENQFNYKAAYDLAVQTNGASLPVTFKFGSTLEPLYYTFESLADISDFYVSAMTHINNVLVDGWKKKDAIDWTQWTQYLIN